ncbi:FAD-binding oxidoreductase [Aliihoeflea sp. 40Bstr573]|uniref:NAD(P)/FAD-dependent oxidoreductase n=1 Tax=Aliihoeflea sp. 40Bstr573 TaxID=2696467 RepID=UPI002094B6D0|nr:FAD-dependent oxidoreductase [Aliihoeflea sp. 40Bstr573]MCO6388777.1 FAD-dependent oxidoreductase [Aliihoeflea sp. 40Bstr573]
MTGPASNAKHTLIIGAGIVGVACALALQERGRKVTLIDRQDAGTATSFGNAGCFATAEITPISMPGLPLKVPGMLLDPLGPLAIRWRHLPHLAPWLLRFILAGRRARVDEITASLSTLMKRVWSDYDPLLRGAALDHLVRRNGALFVYSSEKALAASAYEWRLRAENGVRMEQVDREQIADLEPALSSRFASGYFVTDWAHTVDPFEIVTGLFSHFTARGGAFLRDEVTGFDFAGERPSSARLSRGEPVAFDEVVICGGAWSRKLAAALGSRVPLETERGYNTTLPEPGVLLSRPVCVAEQSYVMTPMSMGLRVGGTVELAGLEALPDFTRARKLVTLCKDALPGVDDAGGKEWMGFRPSMPDSMPVIGRSPSHANAYFAFGHGHLGLTLAATTGRLVADLATDTAPPVDARPFRPDRFI